MQNNNVKNAQKEMKIYFCLSQKTNEFNSINGIKKKRFLFDRNRKKAGQILKN